MSKRTIVVERELGFAITDVFEAWSNREDVERWLSCGESGELLRLDTWSAKVGSPISVWINHPGHGEIEIAGEFLVVEKPSELSYTWGPFGDVVTVKFRETRTGTQIIVEQTLDEDSPMTPTVRDGWERNLSDVSDYLNATIEID